MRRVFPAILFAAAIALLPLAARAGWDEGAAAYEHHDWAVAAGELKPLSDHGDPRAQARYGRLLLDGLGVPKNKIEALRLLQAAADADDPEAEVWLSLAVRTGRGGLTPDPVRAAALLERAARQDYPVAIHDLGTLYLVGLGVPRDVARALDYLHRSAALGLPASFDQLGRLYWSGGEVPRDHALAVTWLRKGAEAGVPSSQAMLAEALWAGDGTAPDHTEALRWFRAAAGQGDPAAMTRLGVILINGAGVPRDVGQGMDLLRAAAAKGDANAAENLARVYWYGGPEAKDHAQALPWLRVAAAKGSPWAENTLGVALFTGDSVGRDQAGAVAWFRRAADKNLAAAQFNLAEAYRGGLGLGRDEVQAYAWHIVAASHADAKDQAKFEQSRDQTALLLLPSEAERARQMAAAIAAGHPPPATAPGGAPGAPAGPGGRVVLGTAGSGFFVATDGTVLTNNHVVPACRTIRVTPSVAIPPATTVAPVEATVTARDLANDLAMLRTGLRSPAIVRFRDDKPMRSGDGVVVVGYPLSSLLSREPNVTDGIISAMAGARGDPRFFQVTAPVQKGNSGGPLADMSGNVVGVVSRKLDAMVVQKEFDDMPQNVNFALKASYARHFLAANGVAVAAAPARETLSTADVGERIKKATVFIECLR